VNENRAHPLTKVCAEIQVLSAEIVGRVIVAEEKGIAKESREYANEQVHRALKLLEKAVDELRCEMGDYEEGEE